MVEYGVQQDGTFRRKHLDEIQQDLLQRAKENIPNFDPAPGSPDRQRIDFVSIELVDQWEALEACFDAGYLDTAYGVQMDRLLSLAGVGRVPRRGAGGEVTFSLGDGNTATSDITIESGTVITTESTDNSPAIPFETTQPATIPSGSTHIDMVPIKAVEPFHTAASDLDESDLGENTNVPANSITEFVEPQSGVEVTNPQPTGQTGTRSNGSEYDFVSGRDRESDSELRNRYKESLALNAKASLEAIRSNVYNAGGEDVVRAATIEENVSMTDNTGSGGLPPKSFRVLVLADDTATADDTIAQQIYETRSAGIQSYGSDSGTAERIGGETLIEDFGRATEITIYSDVDLKVTDEFPGNGEQQVRQNIVEYIGGTLSDGTRFFGQDIGEDVIYDQVFSAAMNVPGVIERGSNGITVGTSDDPTGTSDIVVGEKEVGRVAESNIDVTTTTTTIP